MDEQKEREMVPRYVILDLLPIYLSGEASPATRRLVEEYLARDPELAKRVREPGSESFAKLAPPPPPELELRSLIRTRRLLGVQKWLFGLAIAFTAFAFATRITFQEHRLTTLRPLILDFPLEFGSLLAVAIVFWVAYASVRRRLRSMSG